MPLFPLSRSLCLACLAVCLAALLPGAANAAWTERSALDSPTGNLTFDTVWQRKAGLHLRVEDATGQKSVLITLRPEGYTVTSALGTAGHQEPVANVLYDPTVMPQLDMKLVALTLKCRPSAWTLYMRDLPVLQWAPPFDAPGKVFQPSEEIPASSTPENVWFQKTSEYVFHADFMVPDEQTNKLGDWRIETGDWEIHTTMENIAESEITDAIRKRPPEAQRSPNFYSVEGKVKDEPAILTNGFDFLDGYEFEAAMQTLPGEAGLVFYYRGPRDYYRLTLETTKDSVNEGVMRLYAYSSARMPRQRLLAAAKVPVTAHQWVKPRIRAWDEHIECYLDNVKVFAVDEELPTGGRFGLYTNSSEPVRFDDVAVHSILDLNLKNTDRIRFNTLVQNGTWYKSTSFMGMFRKEAPVSESLQPPRATEPRWLIVGAALDRPHVFAATFDRVSATGEYGVIAGYENYDTRYYRFVYDVDALRESFRLEEVTKGVTRVLEQQYLPLPKPAADATATKAKVATAPRVPVRLMADASAPGELRLYRDGQLVLMHHPETAVQGASGLYLGANADVRIGDLSYIGERPELQNKNRYEKNRLYVIDPFMKTWSSPEGQWHSDKAGYDWYKGDFFGRFEVSMPWVDKSQIHLGVGELPADLAAIANGTATPDAATATPPADGNTAVADADAARKALAVQGAVVAIVDGNKLNLYVPDGKALADIKPVAELTFSDEAIKTSTTVVGEDGKIAFAPAYTIHYEDHCVWVTSPDGAVLAKQWLEQPLKGRHIRIAGYSFDQLAASVVERYQVKDYLFSEALTDWTRNGGTWEIVNRFQCDPRWSHMNAEAPDNIGAIWTKYRFSGDFSVEVYAGIRHGTWYNRVGDVNITMMNQGTTPSQGYTITNTAWDNDHSQLWTNFFRNGVRVDRSDKYLMPRSREGNHREVLDPLIAAGRDVHGAWYYFKFRRIGNRLEYWFDNELVMSREEKPEERLNNGSFGLWTYMNSIVVARVKIAAEHIEPLQFIPEPVPFAPVQKVEREPRVPAALRQVVTDGQPVESLLPENWESVDPVSHTTLTWVELDDRSAFVARNSLGSGNFPVQCKLPARPRSEIAGWRFLVKRTNHAQFNFHYSIGTMADGKYVPRERFVHVISGARTDDTVYQEVGETSVKPSGEPGANWYADGRDSEWTPVTVWLPNDRFPPNGDPNLVVHVDGFGNFQPSEIMEGLYGNGPGESYAVTGFTPITYKAPALAYAAVRNDTRFTGFVVSQQNPEQILLNAPTMEKLTEHFAGDTRTGLNLRRLRLLPQVGGPVETDLAWLTLPEKPELAVSWHPTQTGALLLRGNADYADPRMPTAALQVFGQVVSTRDQAYNERVAHLPRDENFNGATVAHPKLEGTLNGVAFALPWTDRRTNDAPVLLGVAGFTPYLLNFETRALGEPVQVDGSRMRLANSETAQSTYLEIQNTAYQQRLAAGFNLPISLAQYPVMQFRYKLPDSGQVSLAMGNTNIAFAERLANVPRVRFSPEVTAAGHDNEWHTWQGLVTDINSGADFRLNRFQPGSWRIASVDRFDQTGARTRIGIDDIVFGPAVNSAAGLTFTPSYFDLDGIKSVFVEVHQGPLAHGDLDSLERNKLNFKAFPVGQPITPDLSSLKPGICELYVMANDMQGRASAVTSIPFVYDTTAPTLTSTTVTTTSPVSNGTLAQIVISAEEGAPVQLDKLAFTWNGKPLAIPGRYNSLTQQNGVTTMTLNWPYLLRRQLDHMADGESGVLGVTQIVDGAGNAAPDGAVTFKVNHAADKIGPALLNSRKFPASLAYFVRWDGYENNETIFSAVKNSPVTLVNGWQQEPFIQNVTNQANGGMMLKTPVWTLKSHPWITFNVRRPAALPAEDKMRFVIELTMENGKTYGIEMCNPAKGGNWVDAPQPIIWTANTWIPVRVNALELLAPRLKGEDLDKLKVASIELRRYTAESGEILQVKDFAILAPWTDADEFDVDAYDVSGIKGLKWDLVDAKGAVLKSGTVDGDRIKPATLGLPKQADAWLNVYALDNAGNASLPIRLPWIAP